MKTFRRGEKEDFFGVKELYKSVAAQANGIARKPEEITDDYIGKIVFESLNNGILIIAEENKKIIGSINALKLEPECFSHILSDMTFVIHPDYQGKGIGRALFGTFIEEIEKTMPEIRRIELYVRSSNERAIKFYEFFGFEKEGLLRRRIKNSDGILEADVIMSRVK